MNINPNRITNAWQNIKNPCDYIAFAITLFLYTVTLGNCNLFPRAQQALSHNNDSPLLLWDQDQTPIEHRTVINESGTFEQKTFNQVGNCLQAIDSQEIARAANLLKDIFANLPQIQKNEIRRAFSIRSLQALENMDKSNFIRLLRAIDLKDYTNAVTLIPNALPLLTPTQLMIVRSTLANFHNHSS